MISMLGLALGLKSHNGTSVDQYKYRKEQIAEDIAKNHQMLIHNRGILSSIVQNHPNSKPTPSGRRYHCPSGGIARNLFVIVQNAKSHCTKAIELSIAVHLLNVSDKK